MPSFKPSLSEKQRWQVLTCLWSLSTAVTPPEVTSPGTKHPAEGVGGILLLTAPEQARSGQPLTLSAVLQDSQGKPVENATVRFSIRVDFFASDLMEIGYALTNDQGVAVFEYTPRLTGDIEVVVRYEAIETTVTLAVAEPDESFYRPEAVIQFPAPGKEVFIGPKSALKLGEGGKP